MKVVWKVLSEIPRNQSVGEVEVDDDSTDEEIEKKVLATIAANLIWEKDECKDIILDDSEEGHFLKPCPFCGGKPYWFETTDYGHCVECNNCQAIVGFNAEDKDACVYSTSVEAKDAWNRRVEV